MTRRPTGLRGAIVAASVLVGLAVKLIFFRSRFLYAGTLEATKVDLSAKLSSTIDVILTTSRSDGTRSSQSSGQ